MIRKTIIFSIFIFCFTLLCLAAEITGRWDGKISTGNGELHLTYILKADGDKLTGTLETEQGKTDIYEGKVSGDDITFKLNYGDRVIPHQGKIIGDSLKLNITIGDQIVKTTLARGK
jgi:hypothetical protein